MTKLFPRRPSLNLMWIGLVLVAVGLAGMLMIPAAEMSPQLLGILLLTMAVGAILGLIAGIRRLIYIQRAQ